jgi:endonuclease/exonuclease/phosphatase family metal-dependent hydrolase
MKKMELSGGQPHALSYRYLRIGTYNIAHGRGPGPYKHSRELLAKEDVLERLKQIAQLLSEERLDIVVLNEVDFDSLWSSHLNQAEFIAGEAGFFFWAEQRNIDMAVPFARIRYGNAILSRYPLLTARRLPFVGHSALETIFIGKKQGLLCTVKLSETYRIQVLAVHLEHRRESTRLRAAEMIEEVRKRSSLPLIAAGDFNSAPVGFPHATPESGGQTAVSWLLARGAYQTRPIGEPCQEDSTFWSRKPCAVIDWILVPAGWKIISKTTINRLLSDHIAVVMEVEVENEPGDI